MVLVYVFYSCAAQHEVCHKLNISDVAVAVRVGHNTVAVCVRYCFFSHFDELVYSPLSAVDYVVGIFKTVAFDDLFVEVQRTDIVEPCCVEIACDKIQLIV